MKLRIEIVFVLLAALLGVLLLAFVNHFKVDVLFGDKFAFWRPFFENSSFWEGFSTRIGIHRYGLIYVFTSVSVYALKWNIGADMLINALLIASMPFCWMAIVKKTYGQIILSDLFVVFVLLSLAPVGTLFQNNYVHVMLPLFCIAFVFLGRLKNNIYRLIFGIMLTVLAMFSAFSFLAVFAYLFVLVVLPNNQNKTIWRLAEIVTITITAGICAYSIWFSSSTGTAALNIISLFTWSHFSVLGDLILNAFGLAHIQHKLVIGALFFGGLAFLVLKSGKSFAEKTNAQKRLILQIGFPVIAFILLLSLGRVAFHRDAGLATRYYTTLCFLPLTIYFLARQNGKFLQIGWIVLGMLLYSLPMRSAFEQAKNYNKQAEALKICFDKCNTESDFCECIEKANPDFFMPNIRGAAPSKLKQLKKEKNGSIKSD